MSGMYINSLNNELMTKQWMDALAENMHNLYTPGYREKKITFKTILDGVSPDNYLRNSGQGKAIPGTSDENVFLEGNGFFVLKNSEGTTAYTRLGEFKLDSEGVYKAADGSCVQGYILNDRGEIMSGIKNSDNNETLANGGTIGIPTTEIKLWKDPDNGKFLGKYDEFEIKGDGVIYGRANNGKECTPLYKIAIRDFHNPQGLFEYKQGQYLETTYSGSPVTGSGEIRSGLIELSNIDFKANATYWEQAKNQMEISGKIASTYKELMDTIMRNVIGSNS